jgi:hypothetical protein
MLIGVGSRLANVFALANVASNARGKKEHRDLTARL